MPQVRLIIFDLEKTILKNNVNGIPIDVQSIFEAIKNNKISLKDIINDEISNPKNYFKSLSGKHFSVMEKKYVDFLKRNSDNWKESEGIWEIIQWLRIHEIKISLVSIMPALIVNNILKKIGWIKGEAYDYWTCSELVDECRPSPIMIKRSMRHCHIWNISEVIKVSSSPSGLKEGKDAGVFTIALKSDWFSDEVLMECNPDAYFQDFKEMLGWLKLMNFV